MNENNFKYVDTIEAAEDNDLDEIIRMYQVGYDLWRDNENNVCKIAARKGNLEMLVFTYDQDEFLFTEEIANICARYNHVECLNFCRSINISFGSDVVTICAENGSLECLKYCIEKGYSISSYSCIQAVRNNHLEILKYLVDNRAPFDDDAIIDCCWRASVYGYIECFEYCYSKVNDKVKFWTKKYNLSKILFKINFDKKMWRDLLIATDDKLIKIIKNYNKDLILLMDQYKEKISKIIRIMDEEIGNIVSTDVIKYCIEIYF